MGGAVFPPCCLLLLLLSHFSPVWLLATPWTAAHQAPLSMGFSRQEYWSGVPLPSPPCCLTWGQTMVEVMKIMVTSFKRPCANTAALSAPDPAAGHHPPTPPPETPGHSRACLGQFLVGSRLLSPGSWCARGSVCALQESVSLVPCKFWWLYGGVNGDLLQEGLCHTQVRCTQSPCNRPLPTHTSTGDTQIQFWLSLYGLGVYFMPFPGMSSSGDQVLSGSALSQEGRASWSLPRSQPLSFLGAQQEHSLRCAVCLLWGADLRLRPSWRMATIQDPRKTWLAAGSQLTVWWKMPSLGPRLQQPLAFQLWLSAFPPLWREIPIWLYDSQLALLWYSLNPMVCECCRVHRAMLEPFVVKVSFLSLSDDPVDWVAVLH